MGGTPLSKNVTQIETSRLKGKVGKVIRSILYEDNPPLAS